MINTIKIKNVALIDEAVVNFSEGLNIISGETGAGKSVLLDCINLLMGTKADKSLIKNGEDFLRVEGIFEIDETPEIKKVFNELDLEFDSCLVVSRKITTEGKNEAKINGNIVPLSYIKNIVGLILNIHSQNENLTLLNKQNQLKLLDSFVDFDFSNLEKLYNSLKDINEKIALIDKDESTRLRELELLNYQIKEIEDAKIKEYEEEEIQNELSLLKNSEKINNSLNIIKDNFVEGSLNISSQIKKILLEVNNLTKYNESIKLLEDRVNSSFLDLDDAINEILNSFNVEFDENKLDELYLRLDVYKNLHKKYGNSYEEITNYLNKIKQQKEELLNFQEALENLNKIKKELISGAYKVCMELTIKRKEVAKVLETSVLNELKELSMPNANIVFDFNDYDESNFESNFTSKGADSVNILFSANLGEEVKPLNLVASGGEISRLMLAIKTLTSEKDKIDTMIFDELDTGISGNASVQTSKKLAKISKTHQIIAVSHLFQICAMADKNILVKKFEENGKTYSKITELNGEDAVIELCRFLSVDEITDATITHAKEVKDYLNKFKQSL